MGSILIKHYKWDGSFVLQSSCGELVDFALLYASSFSRREREHFMQPCHQSTHSVFSPRSALVWDTTTNLSCINDV